MEWWLERRIRVQIDGIVKELDSRDCRRKQKWSNLRHHEGISLEELKKREQKRSNLKHHPKISLEGPP